MTILFTANGAMALDAGRARPADTSSPPVGARTYWELIDRSDAALLDFDTATLEHDIDHARALLRRHPAIYRNQLTIAKFIEGWIDRLTSDAKPCRFNDGFVEALVEMTAHLRDGDFVTAPGDTEAGPSPV
jgi:hypothetical protein